MQGHTMTSLCKFQYRSRVCLPGDIRSTRDLLQLVESSLLPVFPVALSQPPACLNQLHNIDILLERHDGQADNAKSPGDSAVHLVGAGHFHCRGRERRGEESGRLGRGGRAREKGERFAAIDRQEGGSDGRRGEAEEVEGDEEEFVQGAADEEDPLLMLVSCWSLEHVYLLRRTLLV